MLITVAACGGSVVLNLTFEGNLEELVEVNFPRSHGWGEQPFGELVQQFP